MIVVQNQNKEILFQWNDNQSSLNFIVHNSSIFTHYECHESVTLAYGYIDQDREKLDNAQFLSKQIQQHGIKKGLNKCYGSFIVIHCDKLKGNTYLANDALGDFALHYTFENQQLTVSDLPSGVLTQSNKELNKQRILDFFALTQPLSNGCYFTGISQLSPGHLLDFNNVTLVTSQYYFAATKVIAKSLSVENLSSQYLSLIQQAITFQTQEQQEIAVMMSGGMDSTFVAANCLALDKKVNSFSYVFPDFPEADESQWISLMNELDIKMHIFPGESYWPLQTKWHVSLDSPMNNPYRLLKDKIYHDVANKNIKTLLTGVYADHMYVGHIYWLVDLLKDKPCTGFKSFFSLIKQNGLKKSLKQVSPSKWSKKVKSNPHWLTQEAKKAFKQIKKQKFAHPHPQQVNLVYGIDTAQSVWLDNEYANKYGITIRHPYRDRRVVEFMTSIPAWLLGHPHNAKLFVQNCSKKILPNKIIQRKMITTLKPLFIKGVLSQELDKVKKLLLNPNCQWHDFIKKSIILKMLNEPNKAYDELHYLLLWKCISFEMWQIKLKSQY